MSDERKTESAKYAAFMAITQADFLEAASSGDLTKSAKVAEAFRKAKAEEPAVTFTEFTSWFAE